MRTRTLPLDAPSFRLGTLRFLANGALLAVRTDDRADNPHRHVLHAWDVDADALACAPRWGSVLAGPTAPIVAHDVDGGYVVTHDASAVRLWDCATGAHARAFAIPGARVLCASAARLWLSMRGADALCRLVVLGAAGAVESQLPLDASQAVALGDEHAAALVRSDDGRSDVVVCHAGGGPPRALGIPEPALHVASLGSGSLLVMHARGPAVYDVASGAQVCALAASSAPSDLQGVAVSPSGRVVVTVHGDQLDNHHFERCGAHVWDLQARIHVRHMALGSQGWPEAAWVSDDGRLVLADGGRALTLSRADALG